VEWLFRDRAQDVSLAAPPDGSLHLALFGTVRDRTSHGDAAAAITVTKP
jgi:hypothetical protein